MPDQRVDVVVVGLGPTGAVLANLLGLCGIRVHVLERFTDPYPLPRAVHFDDEIMRVFQTIGVADQVSAICRINVGMRFVDNDGNLLLDWPRSQQIGPHGWYPSYRFHQPELERILRAGLQCRETVTAETGKEVTDLLDNGELALVDYVDRETGDQSTIEAGYIVGCDGANSIVRRSMGVTETDRGFNERWLVTDLLLTKPKPQLGDHTVQYCNPARPATYARGPGQRRRWEIALLDREDADEMCKPDTVWRLLERWIGPSDAEIERAAVYRFQSIIADQWRAGRLLIAGDAAHRTPPFMGQGMCAGIRDTVNLGWKLAAVVRGEASDTMLDSYGSERIPHVRSYIDTAIRLGRLINASESREALDAAFRQPDGSTRMESISPPLGPGLHVGDDAAGARLFPQPILEDGQRFDDLAGYRFALAIEPTFRIGASSALIDAVERHCRVVELADFTELAVPAIKTGARAILIRPDRYILGTATDHRTLSDLIEAIPAAAGASIEGSTP